ncbi:MAG: hypothetical protein BGO32_01935 [Bacteroidetes bacterium 37-13]|nr:MAG: hypothetical protein BGO32_01935 [Bacteroidetes bacterium 37-13]
MPTLKTIHICNSHNPTAQSQNCKRVWFSQRRQPHEKKPSDNKVLPKAGLNGFDWTFLQGSTFVLRLNFCAKIPAFGNTRNVGGNLTDTATN